MCIDNLLTRFENGRSLLAPWTRTLKLSKCRWFFLNSGSSADVVITKRPPSALLRCFTIPQPQLHYAPLFRPDTFHLLRLFCDQFVLDCLQVLGIKRYKLDSLGDDATKRDRLAIGRSLPSPHPHL